MSEIKRTRRPNVVLRTKKLENILRKRARGHTLEAIAGLFDLNSRQEVYQIIKKNRNRPELAKLYKEIEKTQKFLRRKL